MDEVSTNGPWTERTGQRGEKQAELSILLTPGPGDTRMLPFVPSAPLVGPLSSPRHLLPAARCRFAWDVREEGPAARGGNHRLCQKEKTLSSPPINPAQPSSPAG